MDYRYGSPHAPPHDTPHAPPHAPPHPGDEAGQSSGVPEPTWQPAEPELFWPAIQQPAWLWTTLYTVPLRRSAPSLQC